MHNIKNKCLRAVARFRNTGFARKGVLALGALTLAVGDAMAASKGAAGFTKATQEAAAFHTEAFTNDEQALIEQFQEEGVTITTPDKAPFYARFPNVLKEKCVDGRLKFRYRYIRIRYGYTNRTFLREVESVLIGIGNPEWGAPDHDVIIIKYKYRDDYRTTTK